MQSISQESNTYLVFLEKVQKMCSALDFRLVGGAFTNLLTPHTTISSLDCSKRILRLKNHAFPTMYRKDGSMVDVDMICFTKSERLVNSVKRELKEWERGEAEKGSPIPHVSLEQSTFEEWGKKKNTLFAFVTSIEIDKNNKLYLTFDNIKEEIPWDTVGSWTIILDNGIKLQTLNPYAHMLRYFMRMPSGLKPKDKRKIQHIVQPFLKEFLKKSQLEGQDYEKEYTEWNTFIKRLATNKNPQVRIKSFLTNLYWHTLGTTLAHGKGIFYTISTWGDKFTG